MAITAMDTAAQSGEISMVIKKDKQGLFRDWVELEKYLGELLAIQEGVRAITGAHPMRQAGRLRWLGIETDGRKRAGSVVP